MPWILHIIMIQRWNWIRLDLLRLPLFANATGHVKGKKITRRESGGIVRVVISVEIPQVVPSPVNLLLILQFAVTGVTIPIRLAVQAAVEEERQHEKPPTLLIIPLAAHTVSRPTIGRCSRG